jgi:hypothetical protein
MFDVFYLDQPTGLFPHERKASSVEDAAIQSRTSCCWVLNYLCDYTGFDFLYQPLPHQCNQAHVWPSQHQENSGTWLIPRITGTVQVNRDHDVVERTKSATRIHIKHIHGSPDSGDVNVRYVNDYLGTMRRALSKVNYEYCWITADVCDYTNFDFTWHPSEWQLDMLHVFASDDQKFGDTFYVHVPSFLEKTKDLKVLEWFETLHFVEDISVPRHPIPTVRYETDSVVPAVWSHEFTSPLVQFYRHKVLFDDPVISLWQDRTKTVMPLNKGSENVIVPRECKNYLKTQLYDYPYIDKSIQDSRSSQPLDVVFISNGEGNADDHWYYLESKIVNLEENRLVRVNGVKGRVASYHAAAEASNTEWFFAVFAKLVIDYHFDWTWQPDRMQEPKHYIFHARNPINGLVYGHQAMIAYNKKLVLDNPGVGLDFTLDSPHEVVPILSGTANYGYSDWMCWRTAFREALKLKSALPDVEAEYRLRTWLTPTFRSDAKSWKWSHIGAEDAVEYYNEVGGDFDALKKSYDWAWLSSYAFLKHSLVPDQ